MHPSINPVHAKQIVHWVCVPLNVTHIHNNQDVHYYHSDCDITAIVKHVVVPLGGVLNKFGRTFEHGVTYNDVCVYHPRWVVIHTSLIKYGVQRGSLLEQWFFPQPGVFSPCIQEIEFWGDAQAVEDVHTWLSLVHGHTLHEGSI